MIAADTGVCETETHEQLKRDDAAWSSLAFIGLLPDEDDDGAPAPLALANCRCGSTLARRATAEEVRLDAIVRHLRAQRRAA